MEESIRAKRVKGLEVTLPDYRQVPTAEVLTEQTPLFYPYHPWTDTGHPWTALLGKYIHVELKI